jgi:hypothetical protein
MNEKRHCPECNYHLDDYAENEALCGACLNVAEMNCTCPMNEWYTQLCDYCQNEDRKESRVS